MSRRWENKEVAGRGTKYCLVIDPEDGTHPIKTYGWSVEEVLDKVANTAETAQQVINRQRNNGTASSSVASPKGATSPTPVAPVPRTLTPEEQMQATSDLSNPSKSPQAIQTLLRGVGVDVEKIKNQEYAERIASIAQEWERRNPDWPSSDKNRRLLMDKAALMFGFNITAESLDAAYRELSNFGMLFEVESEPQSPTPPDAPNGNAATRIEGQSTRTATSYRSHSLRSDVVVPATKPRYTRSELDAMTSRQLRDKIENEPGFKQWYESTFSRAATA